MAGKPLESEKCRNNFILIIIAHSHDCTEADHRGGHYRAHRSPQQQVGLGRVAQSAALLTYFETLQDICCQKGQPTSQAKAMAD